MERRGRYSTEVIPRRRGDPALRDLADGLRTALRDEWAEASDQEMQDAVGSMMDSMSPAEAFNFGSVLSQLSKGAGQVLSDPTFQAVAKTALPLAAQVVGTMYGGPLGGAVANQLGNLAVNAITGSGTSAPAPRPAAPRAPAPAGVSAVTVAGGSDAAKQALVLGQQQDVLRSLLATALGGLGQPAVSGIPNAKLLSEMSRLFGEAAADADALAYLEQESESAESAEGAGRPATLYADLLGADDIELAEAAEWGEAY